VEFARLLETRSLLSQFMTRTRKRELDLPQAVRQAQVLEVEFDELEQQVYEKISRQIRKRVSNDDFYNFSLMMRQRQMTSSLVATLKSWKESEFLDDLVCEVTSQFDTYKSDVNEIGHDFVDLDEASIEELEARDSKFDQLSEFISKKLKENPQEKFVIFAYFRATINYLEHRLKKKNIGVSKIVGGMGDEKLENIRNFKDQNGLSVLLSSEVGTEGIDLQFCRILINYDLPWNPMRVEQRIGRIDRLGQKAETISIVNLSVSSTIEDRVLGRLYKRLGIFEDSIGDLEEILGDRTKKLMIDLLKENLSDDQLIEKAEQEALAIENQRNLQEKLEGEAINFIGLGQYIMDNITASRNQGRWISGEELFLFVDDFFLSNYQGTKIQKSNENELKAEIQLSPEAKSSLKCYIVKNTPPVGTTLCQDKKAKTCSFDARYPNIDHRRYSENIDSSHPLIQWICDEYSNQVSNLSSAAAISIKQDCLDVETGYFVYVVQKWSFKGQRSETTLAYKVAKAESQQVIDSIQSELLIVNASRGGRKLLNIENQIKNYDKLVECIDLCKSQLNDEFGAKLESFMAENEQRCKQQEISAKSHTNRVCEKLEERLERFRREGKTRMIPATEGSLNKAKIDLDVKLQKIKSQREKIDQECKEIAVGIIRVTK